MRVNSFVITSMLVYALCVLTGGAVPMSATSGEPFAPSGVEVLSSRSQELVLRIVCRPVSIDTVRTGRDVRLVPRYQNLSERTVPGTDRVVPCVRELISVPSSSGFRVSKLTVYSHSCIAPEPNNDAVLSPVSVPQTMQTALSGSEASSWMDLSYLGIAADKHIARIIIQPLQYSASGEVDRVCDSAVVHITFDPSTTEYLPRLDTKFSVTTLNDAVNEQWRSSSGSKSSVVQGGKLKQRFSAESISDGTWLKISLTQEGVYKIDAQQLSKAGVSIPASKVSSIKVFGNGGRELSELPSESVNNVLNEQGIITKTNSDGSLAEVVFYGAPCRGFDLNSKTQRFEHYINHYGETNYYYLTWGGRDGLRQVALPIPPGEIVKRPTQFTARVLSEDEIVNAYLSGSGRRWFGQQLDAVIPRTITTKLPGFLATGTVQYIIDVAHRESMDSQLRAIVNVSENNQPLAAINLRGVYSSGYEEFISSKTMATMDASKVAADGTSMLKFEYTNPYVSGGGNGFLDYFEVHYPAQMVAINNKLSLYSDIGSSGITQYTVSGFTSSDIVGFDVSDTRTPTLLTNTSTAGNIYSFVTNLDSTKAKRFYIASATQSPDIQLIQWKNLRTTSFDADVIVICPAEFDNSAQAFKTYREKASGLSVAVFDVEDIFNEYGSGIADPSAIRDFIADAVRSWNHKPSYVVMWGDGHYDYKNLTTTRKNYITTWQTDDVDTQFDVMLAGVYTSSYTTDDYFVRIAGNDDLTDLAIGRLPIDSRDNGDWMVEKIKHYEQNSAQDVWRTTATFLADDGPTSNNETNGTTHVDQSEDLTADSTCVPHDIIQRKIYLSEYPAENIPKGRLKPRVTEDLLAMVNGHGTLLLNWIGHGNPKVWAHETILSRDITIPQFSNIDKLFFLVAATCDFGRCDMTDNQSGAELMLMSKRGGAIGTFSASRVSFSALNAVIGRAFFKQLFTRDAQGNYRSLGDVVWSTKQLHTGENDQKYFLLGDPTCKLVVPNLVVEFDSINGQPVKTQTQVRALSSMNVAAHIRSFGSANVISDYNGSVTLSLFDSDIIRRFQDPSGLAIGDSSLFVVDKVGGALHRGNYPVREGRFQAEFVVPKDIAFSNSVGRLFAYARSEDDRHAKGETSSFIVGGIDSSGIADTDGPEIKLYMDARTFVAGDVIRKNPFLIVDLFDQTGINSTGIGIGHKIEAWIDDNIESIDLSEYYSSSLTDSRQGTAIKQLFALDPGHHALKVRVWDVLNNYSESRTSFIVADNDSIVRSGRLSIVPNPFSTSTSILFTHNQTFAFDVHAKIYSSLGQMVRSYNQSIDALQSGTFVWNGKDDQGNDLSQGSYLVVLECQSPDGSIQLQSGVIVLLRY